MNQWHHLVRRDMRWMIGDLHHGRNLPTEASVGVGYLCRQLFWWQDLCRQKIKSRGKSSRGKFSRQILSLPTHYLLAYPNLSRHFSCMDTPTYADTCLVGMPNLCRHTFCLQISHLRRQFSCRYTFADTCSVAAPVHEPNTQLYICNATTYGSAAHKIHIS